MWCGSEWTPNSTCTPGTLFQPGYLPSYPYRHWWPYQPPPYLRHWASSALWRPPGYLRCRSGTRPSWTCSWRTLSTWGRLRIRLCGPWRRHLCPLAWRPSTRCSSPSVWLSVLLLGQPVWESEIREGWNYLELQILMFFFL